MANYSKQRNVILEILKNNRTHPTAAEVYRLAREKLPNISLGTVYRNLSKLAQDGDILSLSFGDGNEHFDAFTGSHLHLHCIKCGKTVDVPMEDTAAVCRAIENGFTPARSVQTVYGICKNCNDKQSLQDK